MYVYIIYVYMGVTNSLEYISPCPLLGTLTQTIIISSRNARESISSVPVHGLRAGAFSLLCVCRARKIAHSFSDEFNGRVFWIVKARCIVVVGVACFSLSLPLTIGIVGWAGRKKFVHTAVVRPVDSPKHTHKHTRQQYIYYRKYNAGLCRYVHAFE